MSVVETNNPTPSVNVFPNGNNGGFGGFGDFFGGSSGGAMFFLIIIFFFLMMFMGWGNNNGNAAGNYGGIPMMPFIPYGAGYNGGNDSAAAAVRSGFDQSAVIGGINGVQNQLQVGFSNAEVSRCNQQANLLATLNNNQNATTAALNSQAMALQNCCCENRANIADVKYALATEACADRAAVTNALVELTAQNNANMNAMMTMFNQGIQALKDDNCQARIEQRDARIAELERQLTFSQTADLVNNSRNAILSNNDLQTAALEQYLAPVPKPAYIVQNPSCCNNGYNGNRCPCSSF